MFYKEHIKNASFIASAPLRSTVKLTIVEDEIVTVTLTTPAIAQQRNPIYSNGFVVLTIQDGGESLRQPAAAWNLVINIQHGPSRHLQN